MTPIIQWGFETTKLHDFFVYSDAAAWQMKIGVYKSSLPAGPSWNNRPKTSQVDPRDKPEWNDKIIIFFVDKRTSVFMKGMLSRPRRAMVTRNSMVRGRRGTGSSSAQAPHESTTSEHAIVTRPVSASHSIGHPARPPPAGAQSGYKIFSIHIIVLYCTYLYTVFGVTMFTWDIYERNLCLSKLLIFVANILHNNLIMHKFMSLISAVSFDMHSQFCEVQ